MADTTIDDPSPLIDYQPPGAWLQQNGGADTIGGQYYGESSTYTETLGATASFSFNGTSITIFGTKGENHGNYTVNLDGVIHESTGLSSPPESYQVPLFTASGLPQSLHVVVISNLESATLDIDYITWTSDIGSQNDGGISRVVVEDTSDAFMYYPQTAWSTKWNLSHFSDSTGHTTSTSGASVIYKFSSSLWADVLLTNCSLEGDAISLYGTVGPENSPYTVQLDNGPKRTFQATKNTYMTRMLLFYASDLGKSKHTVVVTNGDNKNLEIDYALIERAESPYSRTQTPQPDPSVTTYHSQGQILNGPAIAGIIIAALVIISLIFALWFVARRNKFLWGRLQRGYMVQSQFDPTSPSMDPINPKLHGGEVARASRRDQEYSPQTTNTSIIRPSPAARTLSLVSNASSSSTLVAEDGSNASVRQSSTRRKHNPRRIVGTPINARSPSDYTPSRPPHLRSVGGLPHVEPMARIPELAITAVDSEDVSASVPVPRGRSSPTGASRDMGGMEDPSSPQEQSPLSPVLALYSMSWEPRGLVESGIGSPSPSEQSPLSPGYRRWDSGTSEMERMPFFRTRRIS